MSETERPGVAPERTRYERDFPIEWARDHYVTRRELAKFLTLGSALLAVATGAIAAMARFGRRGAAAPPLRIASAAAIPPGGSTLFRYPTEEDPCILIRSSDGALRAYSQVCTHLSCAVVHKPDDDELFCPCHHGHFSATDGRPTAGPPTRRLPVIRCEIKNGEVFAVGKEV
jgi:nitrite reductase/ring-hydroxylating ferredoxin subunit